MIRIQYRQPTGSFRDKFTPEEIPAALAESGGCLWIDICYVPSQRLEVEQFLRSHFKFHPLSIDDALNEAHLSRVDDWEEYLYLVLHGLHLEVNRSLDPLELDVFLGPNFLVTMHEEPIEALDKVWTACQNGREHRFAHGAAHLLYILLDQVVSDYMPVVDGLDEELDEIEQEIYTPKVRTTVNRIFRLRRTLLRLRRLLGYLRETLSRLARDDFQVIDEKERVYFRDCYDHVVRLFEITEGLRDMANGAMESYMSVTSTRINEVMRTLTVVTLLFMPLSTLVGFFGMNFFADGFQIENPVPAAVWFVLCMFLLLAVPPSMLYWMERRGWLQSHMLERPDDSSAEDQS